jgi:predicted acylesterase/phospholipase RssA
MNGPTTSRRAFVTGACAVAALPAPVVAAAPPAIDLPRVDRALVLSGGGARGAYEAGIIDYLRLSRQIPDGQPLAPYGFVTGTSIGALNGYFVATGQYDRLRDLWYTVADQRIVVAKPQYDDIRNPDSGIITRAYETALLIKELTSNDTGVVDGGHLRKWMAAHIDPQRPVLMPFVWAVTNLSRQAPEFFYLLPRNPRPEMRAEAVQAVQLTVGARAVLREATPDVLIDALRASAAIPIAFDPVLLPAPDGNGMEAYVDGGVLANTPVSIGRVAARRIDVVLLDPPFQDLEYRNAIDIGIGVFGSMQRRILDADLRAAYLESTAKGAIQSIRTQAPGIARVLDIDTSAVERLENTLFATQIFRIQPQKQLAVGVAGFNDREDLFTTFKTGFNDAASGFVPYELDDA